MRRELHREMRTLSIHFRSLIAEERSKMWFVGTPDQLAEKMRGFMRLGVELFMLQHFLQEDREGLELLSSVLPAVK